MSLGKCHLQDACGGHSGDWRCPIWIPLMLGFRASHRLGSPPSLMLKSWDEHAAHALVLGGSLQIQEHEKARTFETSTVWFAIILQTASNASVELEGGKGHSGPGRTSWAAPPRIIKAAPPSVRPSLRRPLAVFAWVRQLQDARCNSTDIVSSGPCRDGAGPPRTAPARI